MDDTGRTVSANDRERPGVSLGELRRTEVRRKEAEKQAANHRTNSTQHASSGSDQAAAPPSIPPPPPYPGFEEVRVSLAGTRWLRFARVYFVKCGVTFSRDDGCDALLHVIRERALAKGVSVNTDIRIFKGADGPECS